MKYDITFHPSWWHKNAGIDFTQDFFDDPEYRMDCDIRMRKALYDYFGAYGLGEKNPKKRPLLGSDLLACGYLYSELMGCEIIYQKDNSPQVKCMHIDEDSIDGISIPDLDQSKVWVRTQRQIDYLKKNYGHVETYINLMGIQNIAMDIMGQDVLLSYYTAPEEIDRLLHKITVMSIDVGKRFKALSNDVSGGVTAIIRQTTPNVYLTSNCSIEMVSNDVYENFLLQYDQMLADTFKHFGVHHCGKSMEHVVDGYAKLKGLEFAEVGAFSDLKTIRKKLPEVFLNARYSPVRLTNAENDDIKKEVEILARDGQVNDGLLSISCVGIDKDVPTDHIIAFLDACKSI